MKAARFSAPPMSAGSTSGVTSAVWHSLFWLVIGNAVGCMIAVLLLLPGLNAWLGEWTYGRWIMVHMNLMLYGWSSLPLIAFLFFAYGADRGQTAAWCRPVLWGWSGTLALGAFSWLSGHSSGKLFLDWSGYARIVFPLAILALWILLAAAFILGFGHDESPSRGARIVRLLGLLLLLAVPSAIYFASSPGWYPPVNPDTGGPTGASQLESSLAVVAILLLLPFGLTRREKGRSRVVIACWLTLLAESLLCIALGRADASNHSPVQYLSLGSLLVWLPLVPAYYARFVWHENTRSWRKAFLWWWGGLVISGWVLFLPGVLDRFKFTDGLVGHSFTAMAGFASALLIFVMTQLLGDDSWALTGRVSFHVWNWSVLGYVVLMTVAGWLESSNPAFSIVAGPARNVIYILRLISGLLMLAASVTWLMDTRVLLRERIGTQEIFQRRKTA